MYTMYTEKLQRPGTTLWPITTVLADDALTYTRLESCSSEATSNCPGCREEGRRDQKQHDTQARLRSPRPRPVHPRRLTSTGPQPRAWTSLIQPRTVIGWASNRVSRALCLATPPACEHRRTLRSCAAPPPLRMHRTSCSSSTVV